MTVMRRPRLWWIALGLFSILLFAFAGFWLWAEFGFERTVVLYETARAPEIESAVPKAATVEAASEETTATQTAEVPSWLTPARWSMMAGAGIVAFYIAYLEAVYRRRQRSERLHTKY